MKFRSSRMEAKKFLITFVPIEQFNRHFVTH